MLEKLKTSLWQNFGAAIDMLANSIAKCPKEMWETDKRFLYLSYHTVIFLDYYLSIPQDKFSPALAYTLADSESLPAKAVDDVLPLRDFEQQEVMDYIFQIKAKCRDLILGYHEDHFIQPWIKATDLGLHLGCPQTVANYSVLEILFYNLRHLQHHVGQFNLLLRQKTDQTPDWIAMVD